MVGNVIGSTVLKMTLAKSALKIVNVRRRQNRRAKQQQRQAPGNPGNKAFTVASGFREHSLETVINRQVGYIVWANINKSSYSALLFCLGASDA